MNDFIDIVQTKDWSFIVWGKLWVITRVCDVNTFVMDHSLLMLTLTMSIFILWTWIVLSLLLFLFLNKLWQFLLYRIVKVLLNLIILKPRSRLVFTISLYRYNVHIVHLHFYCWCFIEVHIVIWVIISWWWWYNPWS